MNRPRGTELNGAGFWLAVAALVLLCVPYPFAGSAGPLVLGVPAWLGVSFAAAVGISALSIHRIRRGWDLARHVLEDEDREAR